MKTKQKIPTIPAVILAVLLLFAGSFFLFLRFADWGFARTISFSEQLQRLVTVHTAENWLGTQEGTDDHRKILQIYNNHLPLAQGYTVTADDSW